MQKIVFYLEWRLIHERCSVRVLSVDRGAEYDHGKRQYTQERDAPELD